MLFQHALVEKLNKAGFSEVFRRPPVSTQQILHPEKYFAGARPVVPPLPQLVNQRAWRNFTDGEIGELDHAILLRQYAGEPDSAALSPDWRGGCYRLFENKTDKRLVMAYASEWAGAAAARKFFALYQRVLKGKWKTLEVDSQSENAVAGRGDDGYFLLRRDGARVTSLEGMTSPRDAAPAPPDAIH
jgi:hypothetical protein